MALRHVVIHKKRGETPLGAIEAWKKVRPAYAGVPASYAGRLDPMAEGKLLVLLGSECRRQKQYTKLDKEYEVEVLLDLATDTGDVLGLPGYSAQETYPSKEAVRGALEGLLGTHTVPYPAFSSKPVNGKPLFMYALEGTLGTIDIPEHAETIYRAKLLSLKRVPSALLRERIAVSLATVPRSNEPSKALGADFRQDVIRGGWRTLLASIPEREFMVAKLRVACSSGSYMRTLAMRLGQRLGTSALALSIKRTRIGTYKTLGPFAYWTRTY